MILINKDACEKILYIDDDGCFVWESLNGMRMRLSNEDLHIIDVYGNEISMTKAGVLYDCNSPTYDELYEHYLQTNMKAVKDDE